MVVILDQLVVVYPQQVTKVKFLTLWYCPKTNQDVTQLNFYFSGLDYIK